MLNIASYFLFLQKVRTMNEILDLLKCFQDVCKTRSISVGAALAMFPHYSIPAQKTDDPNVFLFTQITFVEDDVIVDEDLLPISTFFESAIRSTANEIINIIDNNLIRLEKDDLFYKTRILVIETKKMIDNFELSLNSKSIEYEEFKFYIHKIHRHCIDFEARLLEKFEGEINDDNRPKLQWNDGIASLGTLFYELWNNRGNNSKKKFLSNTPAEIARFLVANFVDENGNAFKASSMEKYVNSPDVKSAEKNRVDISGITDKKK